MDAFCYAFSRNRPAVVGLAGLAVMVLLAVFASVLAPVDPSAMGGSSLQPPSWLHLMGTDDLGRDTLSRFLFGARISLMVGALAAATSCTIGICVGATAGYFGGWIDQILMRGAEFMEVIPRFFLAILIVALFGASVFIIIGVIGFLSWPQIARLTRGEFLTLREREYVVAARAIGVGNGGLIFSEILPNAAPPLIVMATLQVSTAILLEAGLSFLGLGDPTWPTWGLMLNNAQPFIRTAWWMASFPGAGIFLTVAALNLVGDGLSDVLNPRLRGR
jgi:peptide/nickel transport system permease protein